jgi:hypothetical protein
VRFFKSAAFHVESIYIGISFCHTFVVTYALVDEDYAGFYAAGIVCSLVLLFLFGVKVPYVVKVSQKRFTQGQNQNYF